MVSTRGVKFKFSEGEKVLCYEPDPTKAKVLYDSKVLEVIVNKDQRGRKAVEYLIHFQGWNSSWDRCVGEDYVLKDTDENRQLQRDLAEKAQLQLGAYLYRRDRKKRHRKLSEKIDDSLEQKKVRRRGGGGTSSEDGSSGSQSQRDGDDDSEEEEEEEDLTSSEESSEEDEERVPLELSDTLKRFLELDHELITKRNKIMNLPAEPNVVTILEGYVKHCAVNQLCGLTDKPQRRYRYHHQNKSRDIDRACRRYNRTMNRNLWNDPDAIVSVFKECSNDEGEEYTLSDQNLNICKEVVDGVRIYFDFTLSDLLLYNQEREQFQLLRNQQSIKQESIEVFDDLSHILVKQEHMDDDDLSHCHHAVLDGEGAHSSYNTCITSTNHADEPALDNGDCGEVGRKRSLRSHRPNISSDIHELFPSGNHIGIMDSNGLDKHTAKHFGRVGNNEGAYHLSSVKTETPNNSHNMSSIASTSSRCSTPTTSLLPGASSTMATAHSTSSTNLAATSPKSNTLLSQILAWQLVPDNLYCEVPVAPSLVYGATHLTRLFVKLPDLLYATNMPDRKLKVLIRHLDMFLSYLEEHIEWFGEDYYKDNPTPG